MVENSLIGEGSVKGREQFEAWLSCPRLYLRPSSPVNTEQGCKFLVSKALIPLAVLHFAYTIVVINHNEDIINYFVVIVNT